MYVGKSRLDLVVNQVQLTWCHHRPIFRNTCSYVQVEMFTHWLWPHIYGPDDHQTLLGFALLIIPSFPMLNSLSGDRFLLTTCFNNSLKNSQPILCCFYLDSLNDLIGSQCKKWMAIYELVNQSSPQETCWYCNPVHQTINPVALNESHILLDRDSIALHRNNTQLKIFLHFIFDNGIWNQL